jgi:UDPglucose 6-dehydrogenase
MNVAVVGCGRLGASLALLLAEAGLDVTGVDTNERLLDQLRAGEAPWHEAGLPEMLEGWADEIFWTSDPLHLAEAEVVFIVVPTPSLPSGAFDVSAVVGAVEQAVLWHRNGVSQAVCVVSTVNPGDCEGQIAQALTASDADLVYSPEFIALGDVFAGMRRPDLTLIGESERWAGDRVLTCLRAIKPWRPSDLPPGQAFRSGSPSIHRMSLTEAEIAKLSVNAYVTGKISFANSLGELCERYGARGETVARAIGADSRISPKYLRPGRAFGGPCFPRDNAALIHAGLMAGVDVPLAEAAVNVNQRQLDRFLDLILSLSDPWGRVCVLGMSYKPGTAVTDHSFGQALAWALEECDREVTSWDPLVATSWATLNGATLHADVVVLANDDPAFRGPFPDTVIVDCMGLDGLDLTGCKQYVRAGDGTTL